MEQASNAVSADGQRWLTVAGPVIFLLLWSAGFPIAKIGLRYASPLTFLAIRFALSVSVLVVLCAVRRPAWPRGLHAWKHLIVVGFLVQVLYFGLSYLSMTAGIETSVLALIVSLQPILVGVLAPKLVGERVGARRWTGLILGLAGAAGVIVARSRVQVDSLGPVLLAIGALLGITGAMLYEKRTAASNDPLMANLVQYAVGLVCCAPMAMLFEHGHVQWTGTFTAVMAYLVLCNSLIAISLLLAMTRAGKVSKVAALFFFVPPAAALMSYAFLGETLPPSAWWAMGIAVVGVAIATSQSR
ncbi:EamA family transporter [Paraburkholderia sp. CNPSo 3157]|uniref:EamA family transporter n=1 Tax=Paraburkholderia franconis TaxID=2654983 RepID=A0A7X1THT1_9BURK|nr:DMT family transporter [Paraburkholderia franconis]MPW19633.1 EamA family transporter [Paraburkholderia franconis]